MFVQRCIMRQNVLFKKDVYKSTKMGFSQGIEKTVYVMEKHWISRKEKVPHASVSKEGHAGLFLHMKVALTSDYLEKRRNCKKCFFLLTP